MAISTQWNRRKINRIVDFALALVPPDMRPPEVHYHLLTNRSLIVEGLATSNRVDLFLPPNLQVRRYPRRYVYRENAGALVFRCWCEELLATAAHEIRHVGQKRSHETERPKHDEVDAEAFARFALGVYRTRRNCKHRRDK